MKILKLVIGIVTLSFTLLLSLIFSMFNRLDSNLDSYISSLVSLLFIAAGLISLCARNCKHILADILPALFYSLIGIIFLNFFAYVIPQCRTAIIIFIIIMFVLTLTFLFSAADKYVKAKRFHKDIDGQTLTEEKQNTCAYCNLKTSDEICPRCGTSTLLSVDKALVDKGFIISKAFNGLYCAVFIDDINKKWCVFNQVEHMNKGIYPYSNLIKVELYKDETPVPNGRISLCRSMSILVYMDNLYTPIVTIDIIKQPLYTNSKEYASSLSFARKVISTFEYMINNQKANKT